MKNLNKRTIYTWLSIIISVILLLCTYPSMSKDAQSDYNNYLDKIENTPTEEGINEGPLLDGIFSQVYPTYFDTLKKSNPQISFTERFFPDLEDISLELKQNVIAQLDEVKREYKIDFPNMDYKIINQDNNEEITQGTIDTDMTKEALDEKYDWYFSFYFDDEGILHVDKTSTQISITSIDSYYNNGIAKTFKNIPNLYFYTNDEENNKPYIEYNIQSENRREISSINKCKNISFIFGMSEEGITPFKASYTNDNTDWVLNSQYNHQMFSNIRSISLLLMVSLCVIFYVTKKENLTGLHVIKRIPLEIFLFISFFVGSFTANLGGILKSTVEGKHFFLFNGAADSFFDEIILLSFENILILSILFIFIAYFIAYFYDLIVNKEWKERSLILKYWHKIVAYITTLDMSDKDNKRIIVLLIINFIILSIICFTFFVGPLFLAIYSIVLFVFIQKYLQKIQSDYHKLFDVTKRLSSGDLNSDINEDLGIFNPFKEEMRNIQSNYRLAIQEELQSQHMKTELITNVSHDLKTPLTSIISYIDLLKKSDINEKDRIKYIDVLDKSSQRLKHLIEDLFEMSKANSGNVNLDKMQIDIVSLMKQVQVECESGFKKQKLNIRNTFSDDKIIVSLDSQKVYRILENLLCNVSKYALKGTRVYIEIQDYDKLVEVSIKNISAMELNFDPEEITERFTRGDKSRNTEGSGLGLAIAKSFAELHNGSLKIKIDGDVFKAVLRFPKEEPIT